MSSVCAVVVTYQPWADVVPNIEAIRVQASHVIVIDNGSAADARARLAALQDRPGIEMILNPDNRGVAAALNQGLERALAENFEWVATFDQDSAVPPNFFVRLIAAFEAHPEREKIAVLSPLHRDAGTAVLYSPAGGFDGDPAGVVPVSMAATSGNLIPARTVREHGGYRDDFFIDCVDYEFCLRLRRRGWLVVEVRDVIMKHSQGLWQRRIWLGRAFMVNDYPSERRYYQARNRFVVYVRYFLFDPRWLMHDAGEYARDMIKLLLVGESRGEKFRAIGLGLWHGLSGTMERWRG